VNLKHDNLPVILVTKDTNLRIKADALGMKAEDYESDTITLDELYSGESEITVEPGAIDEFYEKGELSAAEPKPLPNQFVLIKNSANPSQTALAGTISIRRHLCRSPTPSTASGEFLPGTNSSSSPLTCS